MFDPERPPDMIVITRRAFILSTLLQLGGCTSAPKIRQQTYTEKLSEEYQLLINRTADSRQITGRSVRVIHHVEKSVEETYQRKYVANKEGIGTLFSSPDFLVRCAFILPFCVAAGAGVALTNPDRSILIKGENEIISSVPIKTEYRDTDFADVDRNLSISIRSKQGSCELIALKTNSDGKFIFYFDKFIAENNLKPSDYTLEVYHNKINGPVVHMVSAAEVTAIIRANKVAKQRSDRQKRASKKAMNRIQWFSEVEMAFSIRSGAKIAKEIYHLYKKYRWTTAFARALAIEVFPLALAEHAIEHAIFSFAKWVLEQNGYEVAGPVSAQHMG